MKKILKSSLLLTLMAVLLLSLVACGGNKLTATKETDEDGVKYKEELVISFKNDKADSVKFTFTFENEDDAKSMYSMFELLNEYSTDEEKFAENLKQDGKKLTGEINPKLLSNDEDDESSLSKENLKKSLEESGYTVK